MISPETEILLLVWTDGSINKFFARDPNISEFAEWKAWRFRVEEKERKIIKLGEL